MEGGGHPPSQEACPILPSPDRTRLGLFVKPAGGRRLCLGEAPGSARPDTTATHSHTEEVSECPNCGSTVPLRARRRQPCTPCRSRWHELRNRSERAEEQRFSPSASAQRCEGREDRSECDTHRACLGRHAPRGRLQARPDPAGAERRQGRQGDTGAISTARARFSADSAADGSYTRETVSCGSGERAIAGGVSTVSVASDVHVRESKPMKNGSEPASGETSTSWTAALYDAPAGLALQHSGCGWSASHRSLEAGY